MSAAASTVAGSPTSELSPTRRKLCVCLLVALGFSLGCTEFAPIGIEVELARAFDVSLQTVGLMMSVYALSFATATPLLALFTGRFRRFALLVTYAAIFCTGNAIAVFAPTFAVLAASRVLVGAVSGPLLALSVTFLPELVGRRRTSLAISIVYASFSVAMVVATSAGKMIAHLAGWHVVMVMVLVFAVVISGAVVALMPRRGATDAPATARDQVRLLGEPTVLAGIAIFVFGVGAVYVFYGYVTPYLEEVLGFSALGASMVLMVYGAMTLISNLLSGWLDMRFGLRALVPTFIIQAALLAGLFLAAGADAPLAVALILALGISMYIISVPCVSMFMKTSYDRHPKALTLASSLEPMAFNIGIAFGTAVGGSVVAGPGIRFAGAVGACFDIVACACVALCLWLIRVQKRSR